MIELKCGLWIDFPEEDGSCAQSMYTLSITIYFLGGSRGIYTKRVDPLPQGYLTPFFADNFPPFFALNKTSISCARKMAPIKLLAITYLSMYVKYILSKFAHLH